MYTPTYRQATFDDLPQIVKLLAQDELGSPRERYEDPLPDVYIQAFLQIQADPNQELWVVEVAEEGMVGTFQMSYIPNLTYQGRSRAQIEGVRIREDQRGKGLGEAMIRWAIERAQEKGTHLLQLTTNKKRADAIRFYEKLGFTASHEGMKLHFT
ncbi:MAG: GNAT family N-acetyltransferase [Bacteroidota bacterium]